MRAATRAALVQLAVGLEPARNVERGLAAAEEAARGGASLVVFPELAFLPFFPQRRGDARAFALAETVPGPTTERFGRLARELGVVIVLNLFERAGERFFDSSPVLDADGEIRAVARMVHIAHFEGFWERDYYTPGEGGAVVAATRAGRIGVAICYDRHFPEHMRALALGGADLVAIPQAGALGEWPEGMFEAEVRAAAFQNGYFALLANRVGQEELVTFGGGSFAVDPDGRIVARAAQGKDELLLADLDLTQLETCAARRLFLKDRRPDGYRAG